MGLKLWFIWHAMLNEMGMKCLLKNFLQMVLLLIPQHNVLQMHIIQVLLMINLIIFEENMKNIIY